tara:strand:+ start:2492 stop:3310 length:819 start_codon:yes stop_codon:yes gene_type:complete
MPLTAIQRSVIKVLKLHRSEHTFVAGGAALNREWPRLSDDMDIFHDIRDRLPRFVEPELEALRQAGFSVEVTVETDMTVEAILRKYGEETMVQWMDDIETCRRFFPAMDDPDFGFRLHDADNAVNKVLCASRRHSAPRDAVDLVTISERYAPLGPLVWAVTGKTADLTPPVVLRGMRANAFGYSQKEIETVRMEDGSKPEWGRVRDILNVALDAAADYCENVAPIAYAGCLFVDENEVPVEVDENAIANGQATPMIIRDFSGIPVVHTQEGS